MHKCDDQSGSTLLLRLLAANLCLWPAFVYAGGTQTGVLPNGVAYENIATPDAHGTSFNQLESLNVGSKGRVINNATSTTQSQLGGQIDANPNLANSGAASLIIDSVTGASRSDLQGFIEIAGQRANYILANPNGITCNGCGFINTSHALLSTGVAQLDNDGKLNLSVNGGNIIFTGAGMNLQGLDGFTLVTRQVIFEGTATISGNDATSVDYILGRNDFNYTDKVIIPKTDAPASQIDYAIDGQLLGALHAGVISIVSTEAGVGVKTPAHMTSYQGDMELRADGDLIIKHLQTHDTAAGGISITSTNGDVSIDSAYAAGQTSVDVAGDLSVNQAVHGETGTVINVTGDVNVAAEGTVTSGQDLTLNAAELNLATDAKVQSGMHASIDSDDQAHFTPNLSGSLNVTTQADISIASGAELSSTATTSVTSVAGNLTNQGTIKGHNAVNIDVQQTLTNQGDITSGNTLTVIANQIDNSGRISGRGQTQVNAKIINNMQQGVINSFDHLSVDAQKLVNRGTMSMLLADGSQIQVGNGITLNVDKLENHGDIYSAGNLTRNNSQGSEHTQGYGIDNWGTIEAYGNAQFNGSGDVTNYVGAAMRSGGNLVFSNSLSNLSNAGTFSSIGDLSLSLQGDLNNTGVIYSDGQSTFNLANLTNAGGALIYSAAAMTLNASGDINNQGDIGANRLTLSANNLTNDGNMYSLTDSTYRIADTLLNTGVIVAATGDLTIEGDSGGTRAKKIDNSSGLIQATEGNAVLRADTLHNHRTSIDITTIDLGTINNARTPKDSDWGKVVAWDDTTGHYVSKTGSDNRVYEYARVQREQINGTPSDKAKIRAKGNLTIDTGAAGEIKNKYSDIVAGGNLNLTGKDLLAKHGLAERANVTRWKWGHIYDSEETNIQRSHEFTQLGTISAGGNITGSFTSSPSVHAHVAPGSFTTPSVNVSPDIVAAATVTAHSAQVPASEPTPGTAAGFQPADTPHASAASYVPETRPEFVNPTVKPGGDTTPDDSGSVPRPTPNVTPGSQSLSSGINAEQLARHLENDFFGVDDLRQQLLDLTGMQFLPGFHNEAEQMQALYNNASLEAGLLKLTPGTALTHAEQASLTHDILWPEVKEINHKRVLVPKLYLARASIRALTTANHA